MRYSALGRDLHQCNRNGRKGVLWFVFVDEAWSEVWQLTSDRDIDSAADSFTDAVVSGTDVQSCRTSLNVVDGQRVAFLELTAARQRLLVLTQHNAVNCEPRHGTEKCAVTSWPQALDINAVVNVNIEVNCNGPVVTTTARLNIRVQYFDTASSAFLYYSKFSNKRPVSNNHWSPKW